MSVEAAPLTSAAPTPAGRRSPGYVLPNWLLWPGLVAALCAIGSFVAYEHVHDFGLRDDQLDLQVYRDGGLALRHGHRLYTANYTWVKLPFTYPPFAATVFAVASHLSFAHLITVMTTASVAVLFATAWLAWGRLGHPVSAGRAGAALLLGAAALWTEPVQQTLGFGQVNLLLLFAVVADLCLPDRFRGKGVGVGLAAGFKLVPGIFIAYLLLTRRWRAAAVSTGTLAVTVLGAYALFPHESGQYWGGLFWDSSRVGGVDYLGNQSLHGMIDRALRGGAQVQHLWMLAAAVVGLGGLLLAAWLSRRGQELAAIFTAGLVGLLASPISWSHHWVWILPALVLATDWALRRADRTNRLLALLAPLSLLLLFAAWPRQDPSHGLLASGLIWWVPYNQNLEYHWTLSQIPLGEMYTLLGVAFLAGLALHAWRTRRHPRR
ncbi:glycosyltransferase 87 family protein [Streptacidiphilus jiangxiensis]|uniref:Alpha-1,2-mannosyltransferase n=1 Tax=Streptacidiphilus jiangxiensis TaxID=235985 RepID=A0A1H7LY68_STRJI|nr:glycosyltransferase 87 family protein [Streptacidiphilus jiangxiensis]SEL03435.1 alpha-1,2-mannosyltransferase [Streptacidiphilus jiangxiensis]